MFGAFQTERNYRAVQHRYERLASNADAAVVFADFAAPRMEEGRPIEVPIGAGDALGNEWAVVIDAPGYAACLLAWERPRRAGAGVADRDRQFESVWTMDPHVVRRASVAGCSLAARECPEVAERIERLLADRPLAAEAPAAGLTALTNRMVAYLER
jgi:DICT domain-containing protein